MKRYKYITDAVLNRLNTAGTTHFERQFVLVNEFGLTNRQADRSIKYWNSAKQIKELMGEGCYWADEGILAEGEIL